MQVCEYKRTEMQRDMDLIRDVLLEIEADPELDGHHWKSFAPTDEVCQRHSTQEVGYHLRLLVEAGFVKGVVGTDDLPVVSQLTWRGHEFLDNIRDPSIWRETKERLKGLPTVAIGVMAELATAVIKKHIGLT
jgi:Hypothetical protein (DUF2513)